MKEYLIKILKKINLYFKTHKKIIYILIIHLIFFGYYIYEPYASVRGQFVGLFGIFSAIKIFSLINTILTIIIIFISRKIKLWLLGFLFHFIYFIFFLPILFRTNYPKIAGSEDGIPILLFAMICTIITFLYQLFPYLILRGIIGIINLIKKKIVRKKEQKGVDEKIN